MINKKGFTLVELIASLVVLAVISVIVTVNITNSIKNSTETIYKLQLDTYASAVEQWAPEGTTINGVDTMPLIKFSESPDTLVSFMIESDALVTVEKTLTTSVDNFGYSFVFLPVIESETSLEEGIVSQNSKSEFSDYTFVVIKQSLIEADVNNNSNYKYTYETLDTNEKMFEFFADLYFELNPTSTNTVLDQDDLTPIMPDNLLIIVESSVVGIRNIETSATINSVTITVNGDGTYTIS